MDKFAALSDPNRRRIVEIIAARGALPAKSISAQFSISAPAISQHLKVLRESDIVRVEKRAQQRIYSLNPDGVEEMWAWLNGMRQFWSTRFDALETLLKEDPETKK